jgi:hypothetical protein
MLITGIRHAISSELDVRRSAVFMRYLIHYLELFAILGIILPILVGVDYFCDTQTKDEIVTNKYYQIMDNLNQMEYYFYAGSNRFISDVVFYENTNISDHVTFYRTPIFKTVTSISHQKDSYVYKCKPVSIYGWPILIVVLTFICSVIMIFKTWRVIRKHENIKYDSVINLGIINAILCLFSITATLLHIPH